ncbi:MAG: sigma-70 family RNA polymerase sigma factor [Pirellulales bacterium]
MCAASQPPTEELLNRVCAGDRQASDALLTRHRERLRKMIRARLDPRLQRRVDPSDVAQDALAEAAQKLDDYARRRPLPFYPWLRQIAWERLVRLHRTHVVAANRSVCREAGDELRLPEESALALAVSLRAEDTSPSGRAIGRELQARVRQALGSLSATDREVLVLRHVEQLSTKEVAAILDKSPSAVKLRLLRALRRLQAALEADGGET